jgi:signal transduction histidine kinase/ligand-binding sensor domain-containing protein/ActR/RegA family two-component response regulator
MKHLRKIFWGTILLSHFPFFGLDAQQRQYIFEHLQGVYIQPTTYTMDVDKFGRLWYGTWGRGVFVYDGYEFTRFQKSAPDSNSIMNDRVFALKTDQQQRVWVSNMIGLDCMDRKTGKVRHFKALGDSIYQFITVYEDKNGHIWTAGAKGVLRFQETSQSFENIPPATRKAPPARPNKFFEDAEGALWLGRGDGLLRFSPDRNQYEHIPIQQKRTEKLDFRVLSILEGEGDNLWIAGFDGLLSYNRKTGQTDVPQLPDSLAYRQISAMIQDPEGQIWVAVPGRGLYRWSAKTGQVQHFEHNKFDPTSLSSNQVHALLYDPFGNLWVGTDVGLARLNLLPQPFSKWLIDPASTDLPANNIKRVAQDPTGGVLIHSHGGLFYIEKWGARAIPLQSGKNHPVFFDPDDFIKDREGNILAIYDGIYRWHPNQKKFIKLPNRLQTERILAMVQDHDDAQVWWLGTLTGLWCFDLRSGEMHLFDKICPPGQARGIGKILDDKRGHLWLSAPATLARFDKKSKEFTFFSSKTPAPHQLANDDVTDLVLASEGWIWVATASGLTKIDLATETFQNFYLRDGLPDNLVLSSILDPSNNLWLGFPEHLLKRDAKTGNFQVWNTANKLQTGQIERRAACVLNDGALLIASRSGLVRIDPSIMGETRPATSILLTRFETGANGQNPWTSLEFLNHIQLSNQENNITLEWAGIQTDRPNELRYECKLERQDEKKDWEQKGLERQAVYANLEPGAYTFRVRIAGSESPELTLEIAIAPAWWQTESFKMLLMALFATAAYLFWRNREDNRELLQQKDLAEQSARYKSRFLANMSHEIRTPMNAILGLSRLLTESKLPPKQSDYADAIRQSSENLLVIVNDVLDQAKIESGKFKFQHKPFDLALIVRHLQNTLGFKAEEKGLHFEITFEAETPTHLVGDPVRLNQILTNLLGNAIKFTEKGQVTLNVTASTLKGKSPHGPPQKSMLCFRVSDTGIGISPEQLTKVFESFQQADDEISANYGGTGLGLSITKDLVEQQGGKIELESTPGLGTSISATIPFELDSQQETATKQSVQAPIILKNLRILLVEDTFFNQMLAIELLKSRIPGVEIEVAENGQVALEKIEADDGINLILMDVKMPVMDGLEATRRIRAVPKWGKLPIIALTANAVQAELDKCQEVGMNAYVTKPIDADELFATMAKVMNDEQ